MKYSYVRKMKDGYLEVQEIENGKNFIIGKDGQLVFETTKGKMQVVESGQWAKMYPNPNETVVGFLRPMIPSLQLAAILGSTKPVPRVQVVKVVWAFIKRNNLQCPKNRRNILCGNNELTKALFQKKTISMFEMTKHISKHLKELT